MPLWLRASLIVLLAFVLSLPAQAQQGPPPSVTQQPFGQKPPPPPPNGDSSRPPRRAAPWMFRGMVAVTSDVDTPPVIDEPVTGFGNEALWDVPPVAAKTPARRAVAAAPKRR